jgi:hypothetical protein
MRILIMLSLLQCGNACWFVEKQTTCDKIEDLLTEKGRTGVDRAFIDKMLEELPAPFAWAANSIGVPQAFEDCDANRDGTIEMQEMRETNTCLSTCTKLTIVNVAL